MSAQTADIRAIIQGVTANFEAVFSDGDVTKLAEFYTENGMLLPAGSDFIAGREAIGAYWQYGIEMGIKNIKIDIIEVEQHNDTAIEMSNYILSGDDG